MATLLAVTMLGVLGSCTKTETSEAGGSATGGIQKLKMQVYLK